MALGRPRTFDLNETLDKALDVFWRKGYEGASLPDLTKAMGINRPSLYAAFGNKETLFLKSLDRYAAGPAAYVTKALQEPTAREVAEGLLFGAADLLTDSRYPGGCLIVQAALTCSKDAEPVRRELAARRSATEQAIRQRFRRAITDGDLPPLIDPAVLARFVMTVILGMSVQAAGGTTRAALRRVAAMALQAFPRTTESGAPAKSRRKK